MRKPSWLIVLLVAALLAGGLTFAQRRYYGDRAGVPTWEPDKEFSKDVFTFVRIRFSDGYGRGDYYGGGRRSRGGRYGGRRSRGYGGWGRGGRWATDYPDSDLNFSYRLQQLTSMEVDPNGLVLELTDERLFDHPFIYIVEPGRLVFSQDEVKQLRRYLLNGGFLMVDDFWGQAEWDNFYYDKTLIIRPWKEYWDKLYFNVAGREVGVTSLKCALSNIKPERLLFGTDWPFNYDYRPQAVKDYAAEIRKLDLPAGSAEAILGGNAARILGLDI